MLSNKSGVKLVGSKVQNERKLTNKSNQRGRVQSPQPYLNKSLASTNYSQIRNQEQNGQFTNERDYISEKQDLNQRQQRQTADRHENNQYLNRTQQIPLTNKSLILDSAFDNPQVPGALLQRQGQSDCCVREHLPHNELDPRCYKNASGKVGKIPYAG